MATSTIVTIIVCVVLAALAVYFGYQYFKEKTLDDIREDAYQLFLKAEEKFNSDEGQEKFNWVIDKLRALLPGWLNTILSDALLAKLVQKLFDEVEDILDDGKRNGSNKKTDDGAVEEEVVEDEPITAE